MIVLLMGVAGAGKTTIGRRLAARLGAEFVDADDLHPPGNVRKMAMGQALTDVDRAPWLARVRREVERREAEAVPTVIACSALKASHRRAILEGARSVRIVHLRVEPAELERRLRSRTGHFFGPRLLDSQLEALEPPSDGLTVDGLDDPEATLAAVLAALREADG